MKVMSKPKFDQRLLNAKRIESNTLKTIYRRALLCWYYTYVIYDWCFFKLVAARNAENHLLSPLLHWHYRRTVLAKSISTPSTVGTESLVEVTRFHIMLSKRHRGKRNDSDLRGQLHEINVR